MIRYHFTPEETLPIVQSEGLKPYPLNKKHLDHYRDIGLSRENGIYVWPKVNDNLLRDFLIWKHVYTGTVSGTLLRCEIPEDDLVLRTTNGDRVLLWHLLNFDNVVKHRERMDICSKRILPDKIQPVRTVEFTMRSVSVDLDVLIA